VLRARVFETPCSKHSRHQFGWKCMVSFTSWPTLTPVKHILLLRVMRFSQPCPWGFWYSQTRCCFWVYGFFLNHLILKDEGNIFHRNVGNHTAKNAVSHPTKLKSPYFVIRWKESVWILNPLWKGAPAVCTMKITSCRHHTCTSFCTLVLLKYSMDFDEICCAKLIFK
jgi:hypothetical protein